MGIFHLTTANQADTTKVEPDPKAPSTPVEETANGKAKNEETPEKTKTVTVDGPLSHVFTQALQIAYAKEDTGTMELMLTAKQRQEDASEDDDDNNGVPDDKEQDASYVYVVDEKTLDNNALMVGTEALRVAVESKKYSKVILSMESNGAVTSKMQLLHDISTSMGVRVCYSKSQTLNQLK